jgi:pyruvate/2-oxoglutarate dehydrogenase complex dihydrolipoamide dehydrogenase (E3) component
MTKSGELRPDICVIGTDPAGIDCAFAAAGLGVPTMLVPRMPPDLVDAATKAALQRLRALGVGVVTGEARFIDRRRIEVGGQRIRARRYVLATGATARRPMIPGIESAPLQAPESQASHLLVLGGGPKGVEAALDAARRGARISLLSETGLLADFDAEAVGIVRVQLERQGIQIREGLAFPEATIEHDGAASSAQGPTHGMRFADGSEPIAFSHLALACGSIPDLEGLSLDRAGIALRGSDLALDETLTTSNRRIMALGAVSGRMVAREHQAAQVAAVLGMLLFRRRARHYPALAARLVLSSPEIAEFGLRERDLSRDEAARLRFYRVALATTQKLGSPGEPAGHIKVIATPAGIIRGVSILAGDAGELLVSLQLAAARKIPLQDLAEIPIAAPAHAEAVGMLARLALRERLQSRGVARLIRFLRLFG